MATLTAVPDQRSGMAYLAVGDLDRARDFYVGTLGMTVVGTTPVGCVVAGDGLLLQLTLAPEGPAGVDRATTLASQQATTELARFPEATCDAVGIWRTTSGDAIGWFRDAAGNVLSLTDLVSAA